MPRIVKHTVRLSKDEQAQLYQAARERGYLSPTAFIRAAIRNELTGRESEVSETEQRIAATIERLSRDIFRANRGQQALFAVVDTLVKTFLTCVPEPPRDGMRHVPDFRSNIQPCHGQVNRVPVSRPSPSGPPWWTHSSLHAKTSLLTRDSTTRAPSASTTVG